jgi:hypothetical protein
LIGVLDALARKSGLKGSVLADDRAVSVSVLPIEPSIPPPAVTVEGEGQGVAGAKDARDTDSPGPGEDDGARSRVGAAGPDATLVLSIESFEVMDEFETPTGRHAALTEHDLAAASGGAQEHGGREKARPR